MFLQIEMTVYHRIMLTSSINFNFKLIYMQLGEVAGILL